MKSNLFLRVIIFLFCLLTAYAPRAEVIGAPEAEQWVQAKGQELIQTFGKTDVSQKYAALDEMLVNYIDLPYVSKFVMGRYWRQMSSEQQERYRQIFTRYALSIYKSFPLDFESNKLGFEIVQVRPEDNKTTVRTKINIQSGTEQLPEIFVEFLLHRQNGAIQIIDLKLGESSLILSYRTRFYEMIAQNDDDIEWFLEDLNDITEAAERTNRQKLQEADY